MDLASPFDYTLGEAPAPIHYLILTIYDTAIPITAIVVIRGVIVMSNGAIPMGVCYSPYHQQGGPGPGYTEADVEADMAIIAKYFYKIRTYTVQFANIYNVSAASKPASGSALEHGFFEMTCLGRKVRLIQQQNRPPRIPAQSYIS